MSVKATSPGPVFWVLSGLLCACTLGALLVTAIQIKERKMAARYGEPLTSAPPVDSRLQEIALRRGQTSPVGHLQLHFPAGADALEVRDAQDRPLVRFTGLQAGQERGWQELRLKILDVRKDEFRLAPEFRPGSPSFGAGTYLALRPGLRVEFPRGRSATVIAWDLAKPDVRIKVEAGEHAEEQSLGADERRNVLGLTLALHKGELSISD